MLMLMLAAGQDAELGELISTMARVQGLSANRLAIACGVQKSALLRFCKGQQGGYLSVDARERVLKQLGWEKRALSRRRVHVWEFSELADAQFLFGRVLQNSAMLSFLKLRGTGDTARVAVGVAGDAPFIAFATYQVPVATIDPMIANSAGSYRPASRKLVDTGEIELARQSPKEFFKVFGQRTGSTATKADTPISVVESAAMQRLVDLGFAEQEIDDLAEDFLSMQCRVDPLSMRKRLKAQWQSQALFHPSSVELALEPGLDRAVETYVAEMAARPLKGHWSQGQRMADKAADGRQQNRLSQTTSLGRQCECPAERGS